MGLDRWQRKESGLGAPGLCLLYGTWAGQQLACGWSKRVGGSVTPVAVGVIKRGKPSQWKLPCGWLGRPRHCIYRELPATREFFAVELTLSEPRCGPSVAGRNSGLNGTAGLRRGLEPAARRVGVVNGRSPVPSHRKSNFGSWKC